VLVYCAIALCGPLFCSAAVSEMMSLRMVSSLRWRYA
jgi:hypothetical protein